MEQLLSMRRKVNELLTDSGSALAQLVSRAQQVDKLQTQFNRCLPKSLTFPVQFAGYSNGVLTVIVDNAVAANQLRMLQHQILEQLRCNPDFEFAYQIKPKVRPQVAKKRPKRKANPISTKNAELLLEEARHCDDDEMRKVLESLATHTK